MNFVAKLNRKTLIAIGVLLVVILIPVILKSNYYIQVACTTLLYCYFSSCWNLIGGLAGQFALGNGLYIGVGAYCCAIAVSAGGSPFIAFPIAIAISILLAFLISSLCFRLSGTYFALSTVAFLYIIRYIIVGNNTLFGFKTNAGKGMTINWYGGWQFLQFRDKTVYFYILLAMLVIIVLITRKIMTNRMGYYLTAIRVNQGAAATIGIPVTRYKMYAQCLSAAMMSVGGVIYASMFMPVDPYFVLGYDLSLQIMMFCVIGGSGTLFGPIIGAAILMLFREVVRVNLGTQYAQLSLVFFGVLLVFCIMFAPEGIVGLCKKLGMRITSRKNGKTPDAPQPPAEERSVESNG